MGVEKLAVTLVPPEYLDSEVTELPPLHPMSPFLAMFSLVKSVPAVMLSLLIVARLRFAVSAIFPWLRQGMEAYNILADRVGRRQGIRPRG